MLKRYAREAGRALTRVLACSAMAVAATLGGFATPATAATANAQVTQGNVNVALGATYSVNIYVTVTSSGTNRYTLSATMHGTCGGGRRGSAPYMALRSGGSDESWKYQVRPCGDGSRGRTTSATYTVTGSGSLAADRQVHLEAGSWGGIWPFGTWDWGDRVIVTV
ncbi:hypothetical protein ACH427_26565 [Streptomyces sp. NPDC020379]|uniref:hypothetical protein n=1 Tax=Streptomyces sp. NPDC020379 TaxID=3365071 RepID=UPI003796D310